MDQPLLVASSPFLGDHSDFNASSPADIHFDLSPNPGSPYPDFDFPQDNPHFPHTPSYNGSYQNSPYSVVSELPPVFEPDHPQPQSLFDDNPSGITITEEYSEYDPSEYDLEHNHTNILNFGDPYLENPRVSVSVTPPTFDDSPNPFDHSSPASSTGMEDDRRSRASSTSSYHHPNSPQLDLPQNFEGLRFDSPHWSANQLPLDRHSPPVQKPQSPPQLLIPDGPTPPPTLDAPPLINAPDGDGVINSGPRLQIVPATPVSGGEPTVQNVPFRTNLDQVDSQSTQQGDSASWDSSQQSQNQSLQSSQYTDQSSYTYPGSANGPSSSGLGFSTGAAVAESHLLTDIQQQQKQRQPQQQSTYLLPQIQRSRSLSDTSVRPVWDTLPTTNMIHPSHQGSSAEIDGAFGPRSHDGSRGGSIGTVNMHDVLPDPSGTSAQGASNPASLHSPPLSSAPAHQSSFGQSNNYQSSPRMHPGFFGPSATNPSPSNNFLSPDLPLVSATSLRRVKSDSARGHRQSRSEDFRHSDSYNNSMLYPHPPPSNSSQEFISRQYLHPTEAIPPIASRTHRRSMSGSRERAATHGWSSGASSTRASPYPSPSASPRYNPVPLPSSPLPDMGIPNIHGHNLEISAYNMGGMGLGSRQMSQGYTINSSSMGMGVTLGDGVPITVSKVNVTTPSTADASQKRRKQPANFACPIPGCGSTFTRHFNLKGHLRSHAEEKPYQCKWPGCGKGFARQHDCKRHEQLHLNIRPYTCEGCKKPFARMDALNRHLRSEGGAECRKIQEEVSSGESATDLPAGGVTVNGGPGGSTTNTSASNSPPTGMKPDPDGNWSSMVGNNGIVM